MATLIVQSYRTVDVAPWIAECMASVRAWAKQCGFEYEFMDDRFFDYAPAWVRERCGAQKLPVTDVARLHLLRERLDQDWRRVVWIDADVLVFSPSEFVLDEDAAYALCPEFWVRPAGIAPEVIEKVNNSVMMVTRDQPMLDFWIFAVEEILRVHTTEQIGPLTTGTTFYTDLAKLMPLRVLQNASLVSPSTVHDIVNGGGRFLDLWRRTIPVPVAAVNLCASLQDRRYRDVQLGADDMQHAVDALLGNGSALLAPLKRHALGMA